MLGVKHSLKENVGVLLPFWFENLHPEPTLHLSVGSLEEGKNLCGKASGIHQAGISCRAPPASRDPILEHQWKMLGMEAKALGTIRSPNQPTRTHSRLLQR